MGRGRWFAVAVAVAVLCVLAGCARQPQGTVQHGMTRRGPATPAPVAVAPQAPGSVTITPIGPATPVPAVGHHHHHGRPPGHHHLAAPMIMLLPVAVGDAAENPACGCVNDPPTRGPGTAPYPRWRRYMSERGYAEYLARRSFR